MFRFRGSFPELLSKKGQNKLCIQREIFFEGSSRTDLSGFDENRLESSKRRRLEDRMVHPGLRNDNNGNSSNGDSESSSLASVLTHTSSQASWSNLSREEVVRLIVQALRELGYHESSRSLERESGFLLENPAVAAFRQGILAGDWTLVDSLLPQLQFKTSVDLQKAKFLIGEQKFLELLENRDVKSAVSVLRNELSLLQPDSKRLHKLSSYMMCSSSSDLREKALWDGGNGTSRSILMKNVQQYLSSSSMVLDGRLKTLLEQALSYQVSQCLYHNVRADYATLYEDHQCDRNAIPRACVHVYQGHTDEVWFVAFSHDGQYLASASKDTTVIIWSIIDQRRLHVLSHHQKPVSFVAWNPDDSMLISCGSDHLVKLWSSHGQYKRDFVRHTEAVTALAWMPDGQRFVSGALDKKIYLWDLSGNVLFSWTSARITDLSLDISGTRLVAICLEKRILVYNIDKPQEDFSIQESDTVTCVSLSRDSRHVLVNLSSKEVHVWDLETRHLVNKYTGQQQNKFIIRSCFGGLNESFVLSGSEDSKVYLWHRHHQKLIEVLAGHTSVVNSVAWSPVDPMLFASASDDYTVRLWGSDVNASLLSDHDNGTSAHS